jgi:phosphoribosylanthranilate isomerase
MYFYLMRPKVKICCISSESEAKMAIEHGASALGLVAKMPSGPGPIPDELILSIAKTIPEHIASFMLTSETSAEDIIQHHYRTQTNTIQIVDALAFGTYDQIKATLPNIKIVQVIHVIDESSIDEAIAIAEHVDFLLLDSGNPKAAIKELGGTGRTHNWALSRSIVEQSKVPVFLAGGLNIDNVQRAMETVAPYGVDLCSSVRTNGHLDPKKLEEFFAIVFK